MGATAKSTSRPLPTSAVGSGGIVDARRARAGNPDPVPPSMGRAGQDSEKLTSSAPAQAPDGATPIHDKILRSLYGRRGEIVPRAVLIPEVWSTAAPALPDKTLDEDVRNLRNELGDAGRLIETVRGRGYRLLFEGHRSGTIPRVSERGAGDDDASKNG